MLECYKLEEARLEVCRAELAGADWSPWAVAMGLDDHYDAQLGQIEARLRQIRYVPIDVSHGQTQVYGSATAYAQACDAVDGFRPDPDREACFVVTTQGVEAALEMGFMLLGVDDQFLAAVKRYTSPPKGSCVYAA